MKAKANKATLHGVSYLNYTRALPGTSASLVALILASLPPEDAVLATSLGHQTRKRPITRVIPSTISPTQDGLRPRHRSPRLREEQDVVAIIALGESQADPLLKIPPAWLKRARVYRRAPALVLEADVSHSECVIYGPAR